MWQLRVGTSGAHRGRVATATIVTLLTFVLFPAASAAEHDPDRIRLDRTVISGNQELPRVLYTLPWQSTEGRPGLSLDAGLKDESEFRRAYPPAGVNCATGAGSRRWKAVAIAVRRNDGPDAGVFDTIA